MNFEYDPAKSLKNLAKHGISFKKAQILWNNETAEIKSKNSGNDDSRYLVFGKINGKHWTAVITKRNNRIRIISVRRSRKKEEQYYEEHYNE